jgi:hypothetical protein
VRAVKIAKAAKVKRDEGVEGTVLLLFSVRERESGVRTDTFQKACEVWAVMAGMPAMARQPLRVSQLIF